jgi:hypothetical protein
MATVTKTTNFSGSDDNEDNSNYYNVTNSGSDYST